MPREARQYWGFVFTPYRVSSHLTCHLYIDHLHTEIVIYTREGVPMLIGIVDGKQSNHRPLSTV